MYIIVGLGNPGEGYELTRHNTGRMIVENFAKNGKFPDFVFDKKLNALKTEDKINGEKVLLLLPETFMNKSGDAVRKIITSKKKAENLIIIHDDLDLHLGRFKISFAKSSAGHRGVESIIKKIGTDKFIRIRVGISPASTTNRGESKKKPIGKEVIKFLMAKFPPKDFLLFKKTAKKITFALEMIISESLSRAMSEYN